MAGFSRNDLLLFTALSGIGGFILGGWASLTFLQERALAGQGWIAVVGTVVGGLIGFAATTYHDRRKLTQEIAGLKASLYAEIADRAGRCINDYLEPWRYFRAGPGSLTAERVGKFKPMDPVVLPSIAGKLGLLDPTIVLPVTQFYFRLGALSQAIDSLRAYCEARGELGVFIAGDQGQAQLIASRLRSCFDPALRALKALNVAKAEEFDAEAVLIYPHLRASNLSLRDALREYAITVSSSSRPAGAENPRAPR